MASRCQRASLPSGKKNIRILYEKYLQHQQDLYHVFIDFKKAFDRVWHAALWATMKKYNINTILNQVIKNLYNKATSAVLFNSSMGDWFRTTVGIRQGCLLSPTLFNIFLERIMTDALECWQFHNKKNRQKNFFLLALAKSSTKGHSYYC